MVCPTCDHPMSNGGISKTDKIQIFWCPACGTYKSGCVIGIPWLVKRAKQLAKFDRIDEDDPDMEMKLRMFDRYRQEVLESTTKARRSDEKR